MVQNKHFKALVRQRMAKTGERYTTARRHLLASRPPQPVTSGLVSNYPPTQRLLERAGVVVDETATTSTRIAAAKLDEALDADRAMVVRVTHGALPWVASQELEYQDSIDVAVVGKAGEAYLVDGGGRSLGDDDIQQMHRATGAELAQARKQRKADKHWAVAVAAGESTPEELTGNVRAAIAETTGRLLGTLPLEGIPASWLPKFGVQGMRTWAELLRERRTKHGWPALFADEQRLQTGLRMVQDIASGPRWGGPGGLRGLYADFLAEAAALPGLEGLHEVSDTYRQLAPRWDVFLDAVDPDVAVDARIAHFEELAERLEELATFEEEAARALAAVVS